MDRSRILLDIEHDLSLIKDRLGKIEDHFEDDGLIQGLIEAVHRLAVKVEELEQARDAGR